MARVSATQAEAAGGGAMSACFGFSTDRLLAQAVAFLVQLLCWASGLAGFAWEQSWPLRRLAFFFLTSDFTRLRLLAGFAVFVGAALAGFAALPFAGAGLLATVFSDGGFLTSGFLSGVLTALVARGASTATGSTVTSGSGAGNATRSTMSGAGIVLLAGDAVEEFLEEAAHAASLPTSGTTWASSCAANTSTFTRAPGVMAG